MPNDAERKAARAEVQRAQSRFAELDSERDQARIARREAFERAREAGLTLREIGEAAGLHLTRVREVLDRD
jgi:DNA-directed RNA polymerase sigma subunit (sigma70/sigma32)